jgi:glycerol-3-phosphate acyltransferase PlsY
VVSLVVILLLSYLIGSIPTSIITGKVLRGIDIREHGSGNAGGTNVFRVLGWKPGVFVMAVDVLKGFVATYYVSKLQVAGPVPINLLAVQLLAGFAAVFGHIWTVFAGFRGGKGVGTAGGMFIALFPLAALICFVIFLTVALTSRYVSLASITAAISFPIVLLILNLLFQYELPVVLFLFSLFASGLIVYTHRSNIRRLLQGTENRFGKPRTTSAA